MGGALGGLGRITIIATTQTLIKTIRTIAIVGGTGFVAVLAGALMPRTKDLTIRPESLSCDLVTGSNISYANEGGLSFRLKWRDD